jgi:hypothetical protein
MYTVTVTLDVTDPDAVRAAGVRYLVEQAMLSPADASAELAGEDGIGKALRLLIDPGSGIDGVEVHDSACEQH